MRRVIEPSSFRDRDGFVFFQGPHFYRAIRKPFSETWEKLMASGLYAQLVAEGKLIAIEESSTDLLPELKQELHKIYKAQVLPFISYPGEWSFSQLKKAALLTLNIQKNALEKGFCLKDASVYNVQFIGNKAVFIDSLSFDLYNETEPWQAYGQFCRHFLAPLLLGAYRVPQAHGFFLNHLDGIPLELCAQLLPWKSKFDLLAYTHIHLHARMEKKHAGDRVLKLQNFHYSKKKLLSLIEHLEMGIKDLKSPIKQSNWTSYYDSFSYTKESFELKKNFVRRHCENLKGNLCLDLGANSGVFSLIAAEHFEQVLACDSDASVLQHIRSQKKPNVLTLCVDLNNPLPAYGWHSKERMSFIERAQNNDLTLALALVHHLCIGNNLPFHLLADFFSSIAKTLLIEFVPKEDEQVKKLLVSRKDVFFDYTKLDFETAFLNHYEKADELALPGSARVLYLFRRK